MAKCERIGEEVVEPEAYLLRLTRREAGFLVSLLGGHVVGPSCKNSPRWISDKLYEALTGAGAEGVGKMKHKGNETVYFMDEEVTCG